MQPPLKLDVWLQSYEEYINAKNNIKQKILNTVFANISKTISDIRLIPLDHVTNCVMFLQFVYGKTKKNSTSDQTIINKP